MEKFSKSRCLVVLWFNDTPGLRSLVFAVISCSDSDLQDVDGILMFNTKGRTLAIFYLILSCLNYFYPFPYFSSHIPIRAVIDAWNQPIPLFCHFPSFSSSLSSLFGVTGLLLYCPTPFHCVSFSLPLTVIKKKNPTCWTTYVVHCALPKKSIPPLVIPSLSCIHAPCMLSTPLAFRAPCSTRVGPLWPAAVFTVNTDQC